MIRLSRRGWLLVGVAGVLLSTAAADAVASAGRIRPGVRVGGLELGGKSFEEAERLLTARAKLIATRPAMLRAQGQLVAVDPEDVGFFPDVDATLDAAKRIGREPNPFVRLWGRLRTYVASSDVGWRSDVDRAAVRRLIGEWARRFDHPGHEAGIRFDGTRLVPVDPLPGRRLDQDAARRALERALESWPRRAVPLPFRVRGRRTDARDAQAAAALANRLVAQPVTLTSPDGSLQLQPAELARMLEARPVRRLGRWGLEVRFSPELVGRELEERMRPFEREPKDASFDVSGDQVTVRPSQDGLRFDAVKTAEALDAVARKDPPRETAAAFTVRRPRLTTEDARSLRIIELVSTFTTRHPAGQPRVKNIHRIADTIDGTIVRPGEVFSLNKAAGERTAAKGYVMAPMIFDGEFRDEVGGGVSQFATTMFNAVFFGGYEFVSYKPHSYYISRYPPGRDATISWPAPDFKFRNDSCCGILIKTSYTNTSITVTFYGNKEGKQVTAEAEPRTNVTPFPEKWQFDPTLPPGATKVKQEGAEGFDIVVWRVITTRDGKTRRERFFTRYLPEPRIVLYGPGVTPPGGTPAPGASPPPGQPSAGPTSQPATPVPPRTPSAPSPTPRPTATPLIP